jgi:NAD(P)-dependent dehydrogenase (short-subunit alcohol dehydrogenase family)
MKLLKDKVAVVAGATRGAGRGIACMLGEAGATVYCTGRSSRATRLAQPASDTPFELEGRPETIEETAELVNSHGGVGIAVRVDHTVEAEVERLFERVSAERGRLDILVNDIWGGDALTEWGRPFWELSIDKGLLMQQRAVHTHIITSRHATPLMVACGQGLIVEITDGDTPGYRGNLFYDLAKSGICHGRRAAAAQRRRAGRDAWISAIGSDVGSFWRCRGQLARWSQTRPTFYRFRDPFLHRPGDRRAGRRSEHRPKIGWCLHVLGVSRGV